MKITFDTKFGLNERLWFFDGNRLSPDQVKEIRITVMGGNSINNSDRFYVEYELEKARKIVPEDKLLSCDEVVEKINGYNTNGEWRDENESECGTGIGAGGFRR